MKLRKEVLNRLLLTKSILSATISGPSSQTNAHIVARQLLNAHDAADLAFAAIADHKKKLQIRGKAPTMMECLEFIGRPGQRHAPYFKQLNDARNSLKHVGNLPNTQQWWSVTDDVFHKLSEMCQAVLRIGLEDIDEFELLASDEVKSHLATAKQRADAGDFRKAIEEAGMSLCVAFEEHGDFWETRVGRAKAEDALKLTAYGIPANDFLRLQEFLPLVYRIGSGPFEILWQQSELGHPGNWREDVAEFCIGATLNVALGLQNASGAPHAVELSSLYEYRITATEDQVEIWEDLINDHLHETYGKSRPFRTHKKFLKRGESMEVSAFTKPLVSEDISLNGESIKRVRVSSTDFASIFPDARADYVNLSHVRITCVPKEHYKELYGGAFDNLSELPWEEDPLDFSI